MVFIICRRTCVCQENQITETDLTFWAPHPVSTYPGRHKPDYYRIGLRFSLLVLRLPVCCVASYLGTRLGLNDP